MCIDHVLTFPVPLEDASLLADYCGFEVYPTYRGPLGIRKLSYVKLFKLNG